MSAQENIYLYLATCDLLLLLLKGGGWSCIGYLCPNRKKGRRRPGQHEKVHRGCPGPCKSAGLQTFNEHWSSCHFCESGYTMSSIKKTENTCLSSFLGWCRERWTSDIWPRGMRRERNGSATTCRKNSDSFPFQRAMPMLTFSPGNKGSTATSFSAHSSVQLAWIPARLFLVSVPALIQWWGTLSWFWIARSIQEALLTLIEHLLSNNTWSFYIPAIWIVGVLSFSRQRTVAWDGRGNRNCEEHLQLRSICSFASAAPAWACFHGQSECHKESPKPGRHSHGVTRQSRIGRCSGNWKKLVFDFFIKKSWHLRTFEYYELTLTFTDSGHAGDRRKRCQSCSLFCNGEESCSCKITFFGTLRSWRAYYLKFEVGFATAAFTSSLRSQGRAAVWGPWAQWPVAAFQSCGAMILINPAVLLNEQLVSGRVQWKSSRLHTRCVLRLPFLRYNNVVLLRPLKSCLGWWKA